MDKNKELINILKAELTLLSKDILQNIHQKDIDALYKSTRKLYEKMAAIHLLDKQLQPDELMQMLTDSSPASKEISTPKETPVVESKTETAKPKQDNPYKKVQNLNFVPKGEKSVSTSLKKESSIQNLNKNTSLKKINIGLNDRIAFIKYLFDNQQEAYQAFIDRLNAFESYEAALKFINQEIKPKYNDWEGKDEYEFRLLQLLELKFA